MKRERITITIDAELLPAVDALIDGKTIRNRSHSLEYLTAQGLSLHQLTHVFFIYSKQNSTENQISILAPLCKTFQFASSTIVATSVETAEATLWQTSFWQHMQQNPDQKVLTADFGTAAALLLDTLPSPFFLLIDLNQITNPPQTILPAFAMHQQHPISITHFLITNGLTFLYSGISIASQEILAAIPAGRADIYQDLFPALAKIGKVSTYVYAS